jgi:hypothetical protein
MKSPTGLHPNGRIIALPANIRLGRKLMAVSNTLAYYDTATITAVKSFIIQTPGSSLKNYRNVEKTSL